MIKQQNNKVSYDNEMLILVNKNDEVVGYKNKVSCHEGNGTLHRAFSIFIFNNAGHLLMQKRSKQKTLWPLFWSNSCCSHPRKGEEIEEAAERRLREELGINTELKFLFKFQYQAKYQNIGSENELCSVYIGKSNAPVSVNENEIADWKYMTIKELDKEVSHNPDNLTPWFKIEWNRLREKYWHHCEAL
jgi:isopentenyl-diphosphate delta-isomerase